MMPLTPDDFVAFHTECHGRPPFPWQTRLVTEVLDQRTFPDLVDLPTGAGKTTLLDIALFVLAADALAPSDQRWMPRRILLVVDRRVVVDQAGLRAMHLASTLHEARAQDRPVTCRVRDALRSLSGTDEALVPAILRGGTLRDDDWARRPDVPVLGASTVDQVGSRMLFRGYGVSSRAASLHAGLLGRDTLLLLDEVHLAQPFRQTLQALQKLDGWADTPVGRPNQVVELSATPGEVSGQVFRLDDADHHHPVLQRRLQAHKPVRLVEAPSGGTAAVSQVCMQEALRLLPRHRTVAVVVNRVATAREVAARLQARGGADSPEVLLITGRMRPLDRQDLLDRWGPRIAAGRVRRAEDRPLVVVATQCIEAGADLDFDAMVTEVASLDALRQRMGRVDRLGTLSATGAAADIVVVGGRSDDDDPIYGPALGHTWRWLQQHPDLDGGPMACPPCADPAVLAPRPQAPVLLPVFLDQWCQTSNPPAQSPDPARWLHGTDDVARDVHVVWRADLDEETLRRAGYEPVAADEVNDRLQWAPPGAAETLAVPLHAAREWLSGVRPTSRRGWTEVADVEGMREGADDEPRSKQEPVPFVVWESGGARVEREVRRLRPGMVVIVPASRGGLHLGTWDPSATEPVADLGDRTQLVMRGRPVLRLHPAVLPAPVPAPPVPPPAEAEVHLDEEHAAMREWLQRVKSLDAAPPWLRCVATALLPALPEGHGRLAARRRIRATTLGSGARRCHALAAPSRLTLPALRALREEELRLCGVLDGPVLVEPVSWDFDAFEASSFTERVVPLAEHLQGVAALAEAMAVNLGLAPPQVEALRLAALLHDVGKADVRFQRWLVGGDELDRLQMPEPMAKSSLGARDAARRRAARLRAGWPEGGRHEAASTVMAASWLAEQGGTVDADLVLHLIASHHGHARPLMPPVDDPAPAPVVYRHPGLDASLQALGERTLAALDAGTGERFWAATRRYGWHGLALLESILRLADHRRSQMETEAS
jgi:CRISPR-associated endonuclease/helicase Cas3